MPPKKGKKRAAAQPESYDDYVDAALFQGEKSQRHYEEAAKLYQEAIALASDADAKHDALYNLGRIKYALATEIYGLPQCFHAINESISLYRQCLANQVDSMDAAFNLAQSLQTLGEWAAENGPSSSALLVTTSKDAYQEAKTLLFQLEVAQTAQLQSQNGSDTPSSGMSGTSTPTTAEDATSATTAEAVEEMIITPSTVIETILSNVEVHLAILDFAPGDGTFQDIDSLLRRAEQLNERDHYMDSEIRVAKVDATRALLEARGGAVQLEDLGALLKLSHAQEEELANVRRPDPAKLSELADTLCTYMDFAARQGVSITAPAQRALELYETARASLSSTLGRPASIAAHHIPALLSANWRSTAESLLLPPYIGLQDVHQNAAREASLQALNVLDGPIKTTSTSTPELPKFARIPRGAREDYRTIAAMRDTVPLIVRCYLHASATVGSMSDGVKQSLTALIKATWPDKADQAVALENYIQTCQGSASWTTARTYDVDEGHLWKAFLEAL